MYKRILTSLESIYIYFTELEIKLVGLSIALMLQKIGLWWCIEIAYAYKADNKDNHVYVVFGDGECHEGFVWEGDYLHPY